MFFPRVGQTRKFVREGVYRESENLGITNLVTLVVEAERIGTVGLSVVENLVVAGNQGGRNFATGRVDRNNGYLGRRWVNDKPSSYRWLGLAIMLEIDQISSRRLESNRKIRQWHSGW